MLLRLNLGNLRLEMIKTIKCQKLVTIRHSSMKVKDKQAFKVLQKRIKDCNLKIKLTNYIMKLVNLYNKGRVQKISVKIMLSINQFLVYSIETIVKWLTRAVIPDFWVKFLRILKSSQTSTSLFFISTYHLIQYWRRSIYQLNSFHLQIQISDFQ